MRTMRVLWSVLLLATVAGLAAWAAQPTGLGCGACEADAGKAPAAEVTLEGTLTCAHCQLGEGKACAPVLQVKDGDKTVNYHVAKNQVLKEAGANLCKEKAEVKITGTVAEADGHKHLTPTKIEKKA